MSTGNLLFVYVKIKKSKFQGIVHANTWLCSADHMEMLKEFEPRQNLRDLGLDVKGFTVKINIEHFFLRNVGYNLLEDSSKGWHENCGKGRKFGGLKKKMYNEVV